MNTVHDYMALAGELSEEHASKAIEIAAEFILQVEVYLRTTGITPS